MFARLLKRKAFSSTTTVLLMRCAHCVPHSLLPRIGMMRWGTAAFAAGLLVAMVYLVSDSGEVPPVQLAVSFAAADAEHEASPSLPHWNAEVSDHVSYLSACVWAQ